MAEERSTAYEAELRRQALELERIRVALESADKLELERIHTATIVLAEREKAAEIAQAADHKYYDAALVEQQHQIDRRLETQLRERTDTERHLEQKIEAVRELVGQQAKAVEVASEEREKAASQLRKQFAQQIESGDNNLREHMAQQVQAVGQQIAAATRDSEIRAGEAEKAILKQETATERRFESANEWRGQSLDRERSQEAQMSKLAATFAPREVLDAKVEDLTKRIEAVTRRVDQSGGQKEGAAEATTARQVSNGATIAIISALAGIIVAVVVAANALAGG